MSREPQYGSRLQIRRAFRKNAPGDQTGFTAGHSIICTQRLLGTPLINVHWHVMCLLSVPSPSKHHKGKGVDDSKLAGATQPPTHNPTHPQPHGILDRARTVRNGSQTDIYHNNALLLSAGIDRAGTLGDCMEGYSRRLEVVCPRPPPTHAGRVHFPMIYTDNT